MCGNSTVALFQYVPLLIIYLFCHLLRLASCFDVCGVSFMSVQSAESVK